MSALTLATVLDVHHWTPTLFSFTATRDPGFRFLAGQFTMIGLQVDGRPLLRAYSMVNASYQEHLEFLSIKIQSGALTSRLQHLEPGDDILIGRKPTGTLIADNLLPGRNLFLLCTGTGLAPFMSLIRKPDIYDRFDRVNLVHGCRFASELAYADIIEVTLPDDPFIGDMVRAKLCYCPTVTREQFRHTHRPSLQGREPRCPCQHDVRRLKKRCPHHGIADLADPAVDVGFAGLVFLRC